jgi:hypothetical protein
MSLFLSIPDDSSRVVRCWHDHEIEYMSQNTGGKRYARLIIDRSKPCISVWTYGYPIKKLIDEAKRTARLEVFDFDMRVSVKGSGTNRRYEIRPLSESLLTDSDMTLITACRIDLRRVVK